MGDDPRLFLRYVAIGLVTTLLGIAGQVLIHRGLDMSYMVSFLVVFPLVVSVAYFLHGTIVFVGTKLSAAGFVRFHIVYVGQFATAAVSLAVLVEVMRVPVGLAQAMTMMIAALFAFIANRNFTFRLGRAPMPEEVAS
jgi:putative flippase GtrA